ncbi:hypothetical protein [Pseudomonas phage PaeP_Ls]|nr:hypothetical protein [Pseudomonas phage PaeP_Ls]
MYPVLVSHTSSSATGRKRWVSSDPTDEAMVIPGRNPHRAYGRRLGSLGKSTKETIP